MRKFFRSTYYIGSIALFVVVALVGFTQTKAFRSYLRGLIIENIHDAINGDVQLGTLEGNLLTGFYADNFAVFESGQPVVSVERIEARYDPLGVFVKRISLSRVALHNPVFRLTRSLDSSWNIDRLIKPTPPDSNPSSWTINLKQVELKNGTFTLFDSLAVAERSGTADSTASNDVFDYARLSLSTVHLDAGATIQTKHLSVNVRSLSFESNQPRFKLNKLSGEFLLTSSETSVQKLQIETPASFVRLSAKLDKTDLAKVSKLRDLQNSPVTLSVSLNKLTFDDLKRFLGTPVDFLESEAGLELEANGTFGDLDIKSLRVQTSRSSLNMAGSISNLHVPENLELNISSIGNTFDSRDIAALLPGLHIPDLEALGVVQCNLWFDGKPAAFKAHLVSDSKAGKLDISGTLDAQSEDLLYDATVTTTNFDLAAVLKEEQLSSKLNSKIAFSGRGTHLRTMAGTLRAEIDSSEFYGLPVRPSLVSIDIDDRTLQSKIALGINSTRIDLGTTLTFRADTSAAFKIDGTIKSLDLADILRDKQYQSNLTFELRAEGAGLNPDAMRGTLDVVFAPSSFAGEQFEQGGFKAQLNTSDRADQSFHLTSDFGDVNITGKFTLGSFIATAERGGRLLSESVRYRFATLDSLRAAPDTKTPQIDFRSTVTDKHPEVDAIFSFNIKNLHPIGLFLGADLSGTLTSTGRIGETVRGIQFQTETEVGEFQLATRKTQLSFRNSILRAGLDGLSPSNVLDSLRTNIDIQAQQFEIDSTRFSNLALDLRLQGDSSLYSASALIDSLLNVQLRGTSRYDSGFVAFNVERLKLGLNPSYEFENIEPVQMKLGRDGFYVLNVWMRHEVEELYASGYFDPTGISDLRFTIRSFLLNNLRGFSKRFADGEKGALFGGIVHAELLFQGTFESPNISLTMNATGVRLRETVFGQVIARISYLEQSLRSYIEFRSKPNEATLQPDLLISGAIPYSIALKGPAKKPQGEMDLTVKSNNFELQFLEPIVNQLMTNISGSMVCDMKLGGTIESPSYEGAMVFNTARFFFKPLGIQYILDGKLVPHGRQIGLENVTVSNVPQDRPNGKINLSGTFTLEGIQIKDFDFRANGQLLVMKETSRRPGQNLFGDLFGATGSDGIFWRGTLERSFVSGKLFIKNANLTFPSTRQVQELPGNRVVVRVVAATEKDTMVANQTGAETSRASTDILASTINPPSPKNGQAVGGRQQEQATANGKTFLDNVVYDLIIETQGPAQVRFIFTNLTNEELFADIKGRATFTKDGEQTRLTGEVELGSRSYYNSVFKKLDASGKINFTGNAFNPELDVVAKYEGTYKGKDTSRDSLSRSSGTLSSGRFRPGEDPQKIVVKLLITGTREQPLVKTLMEYHYRDGYDQATGDVQADALAFLVTGSFSDELTQQERSSFISTSVLGGLTSSILSGPLTDFLRKEFGIIRSVDVLYYGGGVEESDVRLTGEVGDAVIRLGGRVLNDINNTNVSIQIPMSAIIGSEKWRNLVLEAERRVEGVETIDQRRESKGLRLLYRITF